MISRFLRKKGGNTPAKDPELKEAIDELSQLRKKRPGLVESANLLESILPVLREKSDSTSAVSINKNDVISKLTSGIPLLRGESLPADDKNIRKRCRAICEILIKHGQREEGIRLADAFGANLLNPYEVIASTINGDREGLISCADEVGLDAGLTGMVLRLSLFPHFSAISSALAPLHEGVKWEQGFCPVCGSWPLLGEFRGLEQIRYLRCGLCAAEWEFARLCCPFCENRDHNHLGYLSIEDEEEKYRIAYCDECATSLRMISTLGPLKPLQLLVADVATTYLELAAAERGYCLPC